MPDFDIFLTNFRRPSTLLAHIIPPPTLSLQPSLVRVLAHVHPLGQLRRMNESETETASEVRMERWEFGQRTFSLELFQHKLNDVSQV